ncbi:uroporphyrinogen-III C-methyltransferase [Paenibacillus tarimensis]|uniref:uroporphyrinogen-III C-methyltransferase n=1 Tax=Paenibacillus tarimensis TaxID=416012 RepID=UPI001F39043C|nr:uroporphyrinogen-III C-methyltransferase [Paenibacillus tarimensis]MCF2943937.1 uroporphyrinogen-III C-methyltransferase [Paenibacillus tarimensis]
MTKGKVYLVGAGPGDPKLITVKGLECIKRSDVIVYDRLASPRLLKFMKPGAGKVYVGKLPDRHTMKQEDINQLLVDLALEGKVVTRLKGGDPTIFGRVGEEAELLQEHGIEYEIIPGITSAIAVPAYAGIPVTHRDFASSLSIITGHESPEKLDRSIHWDKVTNATGTLIFLMGVAKIGYISEQLIKHGKSPDTPVALVRWGTRVEQDTLTGTLSNIEQRVIETDFQPPAVIVVGDVVRQRDKLKWVEQKPLFGTRVMVTRARAQASELVERIEELGGEPVEFPVIETREPAGEEPVSAIRAALEQAEEYDWIFFTSVNGVEYFFRWLQRFGLDIRRFGRARIAAVGPKTAEALRGYGLNIDALPEKFQAEGLLDSVDEALKPGQKVLLPRGNLAREILPAELRRRGLEPVEIDVYATVMADSDDDDILEYLKNNDIHYITFTSSSTITNLLARLSALGAEDPAGLIAGANLVSIGPVTSQTAAQAGLQIDIEAAEATIEDLVQTIISHRQKERGTR